ncbi:MAG: hypothetical protein JNJ46_07620 [Myxococcales bacterium]|nr:hypothetical protein [Myxococcales bacterium]
MTRLRQIAAEPQSATPQEVTSLAQELLRWRPTADFLFESLKAIFINAKETTERNLVTDVLLDVAKTCMRRIKTVRRDNLLGVDDETDSSAAEK